MYLCYSPMQCILLYCRALHGCALHCTVLTCTGQHYCALKCSARRCTALRCTAFHFLWLSRWPVYCSLTRSPYTLCWCFISVMSFLNNSKETQSQTCHCESRERIWLQWGACITEPQLCLLGGSAEQAPTRSHPTHSAALNRDYTLRLDYLERILF